MTDFHIRTTCRLCSSPELETLLTLPDTPLANEYPIEPEGAPIAGTVGAYDVSFDGDKAKLRRSQQDRFPLYLVGCSSCGHVQLPVVVDPKRLFPPDYPYQSGTSVVFKTHLKELAEALVVPGHVRTFLDVACNDGSLQDALMRLGDVRAYGVDPCANEKDPMAFRAFFTENWAKAHNGSYDCITALNVFAHVDDLDDFTRGARILLEPCGLFVIEVGYLPDVVKRGAFDTVYHEHLSYHHLSPLVGFFKRHGMTMVDAHRIDSQGGSVRIFVRNCDKQHQGGDDGHNEQSKRLRDLLDDESRSAIWQGVRALSEKVKGVGARLHYFAKYTASPPEHFGGKFAVYGAPAKLTTLLHATDKTDAVEFVVDDNPLKQGRFVPGTRIPILPVSALYERKPRAVLIASWNFSSDIMARHSALGCEWLVPFAKEK